MFSHSFLLSSKTNHCYSLNAQQTIYRRLLSNNAFRTTLKNSNIAKQTENNDNNTNQQRVIQAANKSNGSGNKKYVKEQSLYWPCQICLLTFYCFSVQLNWTFLPVVLSSCFRLFGLPRWIFPFFLLVPVGAHFLTERRVQQVI